MSEDTDLDDEPVTLEIKVTGIEDIERLGQAAQEAKLRLDALTDAVARLRAALAR